MKRAAYERLTLQAQEEFFRRLDGSPIGEEDDDFNSLIESEGLTKIFYDQNHDVFVVCDAEENVGVLYDASGPMIQWIEED